MLLCLNGVLNLNYFSNYAHVLMYISLLYRDLLAGTSTQMQSLFGSLLLMGEKFLQHRVMLKTWGFMVKELVHLAL